MAQDPQRHHRHSIWLEGYDYAQPGAYFITIVTYQRAYFFGEIKNNEMTLSNYGRIVNECWQSISDHFPNIELGAYVVMPNHVHGIIVIHDRADANVSARRGTIYRAPTEKFGKPVIGSIPTIVRTVKAAVTRRVGRELNATGIWQRN